MKLSPIEIATGIVFGPAPRPLPLIATSPPAEALDAAVRRAVRDGRCFVSFSGGRDSSAVLAAAVAVARREGLDDPIPLTIRARDVPQSHEDDWQERVVGHLRLNDWVRIEIQEELDAVGPHACRALMRHGLLWPFNAHFHSPMLDFAAGGTLLTGVGGDQLWDAARKPQVRRRRRALRFVGRPLRQLILARRQPIQYSWLRPRALRQAKLAVARDSSTMPWTVGARMTWARNMHSLHVGTAALNLLASDAGAGIVHPLLDPGVWGALAAAAPRAGFKERDAPLAVAAGHLLPGDVVRRRSKAGFDALFFNDHSRMFIRDWAGEGLPQGVIDGEALREHWRGDAPDPHTLTLLQAAWLSSARDRCQERVGGGT